MQAKSETSITKAAEIQNWAMLLKRLFKPAVDFASIQVHIKEWIQERDRKNDTEMPRDLQGFTNTSYKQIFK